MIKIKLNQEDFNYIEKYMCTKGSNLDGARYYYIEIEDFGIFDIVMELDEITNEAIVWSMEIAKDVAISELGVPTRDTYIQTTDADVEVIKKCIDKILNSSVEYDDEEEGHYRFYLRWIKTKLKPYSLKE